MSEAIVITNQTGAPTSGQNVVLSDGKAVSLDVLAAAVRETIKIGGRNYVLGSKDYGGQANNGTYNGCGVYTSSIVWSHPSLELSSPCVVGETYTLSYYVKGGHHHIHQLSLPVAGASEWTRKSITFKATGAYESIRIVKGVDQDPGNPLSICGVKLEHGNIATDWTPAPEDVTSSLSGGVICGVSNSYVLRSENGQKGVPHERSDEFESAFLSLLFGRPLADSDRHDGQCEPCKTEGYSENSLCSGNRLHHGFQRGDRTGYMAPERTGHSAKRPTGDKLCSRYTGGISPLQLEYDISAGNGYSRRNGYALSVSGHLECLEGSAVGEVNDRKEVTHG